MALLFVIRLSAVKRRINYAGFQNFTILCLFFNNSVSVTIKALNQCYLFSKKTFFDFRFFFVLLQFSLKVLS